jgi:hypothetical protein
MTVLTLKSPWAGYAPFSESLARPLTPVRRRASCPVLDEASEVSELTDIKEPAWVELSRRQLENIQALEEGWDGYEAGPIRRDVIFYAEAVLNEVMKSRTPAPHIAPMSHEGVMIEWHTKGIDLEIEIERPGRLWVSFEDAWTNEEYEDELASNLSKLQDRIDQLTRRSIVAAG